MLKPIVVGDLCCAYARYPVHRRSDEFPVPNPLLSNINIYKNETATATTNPAPPAKNALLFVAPLVMLTGRSDEEGEAATTPPVPVAAMTTLEVVPTEVGAVKDEDAEEEERIAVEDGTEVEKVEVTDATTSETVIVLVMV